MLGKICGPTIVSFIYSFGGISLTYFITAISLLIPTLMVFRMEFKEKEDKKQEEKHRFMESLFKFDIFILTLAQIINMMAKSFSAPTFTYHVTTKFDVSIENASRIQSLSFVTYYLTFKNFDFLMEKLNVKMLIVIGLFTNFISVNLIGPVLVLPQ